MGGNGFSERDEKHAAHDGYTKKQRNAAEVLRGANTRSVSVRHCPAGYVLKKYNNCT